MQAPISNAVHPSAPPTCHGRWMSPEYAPGLVSVIVPTYNRAHLIIETLDSVFAQTYRPIELLIVDDGSTDNTADVVRQWEQDHQQDGFTVRFMFQENRGAPAARNLGLIESRGEFIQFLDSDDLIHPEKLDRQVDLLRIEECDYVWSPLQMFHTFTAWPDKTMLQGNTQLSVTQCLKRYNLNTMSGIYRRAICVNVGPWCERIRVFQDAEYHLRLMLYNARTVNLPRTLSLHRTDHGPQISDRFKTVDALTTIQWYEEVLRRFGELSQERRDILAEMCFGNAVLAIIARNSTLARYFFQQGYNLRPRPRLRGKLFAVHIASQCPKIASSFAFASIVAGYRFIRHKRRSKP